MWLLIIYIIVKKLYKNQEDQTLYLFTVSIIKILTFYARMILIVNTWH